MNLKQVSGGARADGEEHWGQAAKERGGKLASPGLVSGGW